ncbi:MAG: ADP-ribosylglycohydrolase family protein [Pseudomonadota bacterium]
MSPHLQRVRAVLAAACLGDALGAATEGMSRHDIRSVFGADVTDFVPPPDGAPFAKGLTPGVLTDDATQMLAMARVLIRTGGQPTPADAVAGMISWADDHDVFERFAGPTTRLAIEALRSGASNVASPDVYSCSFGASNGAAMRAPAAGVAFAGNTDRAIEVAALLAAPTHNTQVAFAGAAAVAAAIAAGLDGAGNMPDTALAAARAGEAMPSPRHVGGARVSTRLELALEIAEKAAGDPAGTMIALEAAVGNGVAMAESVPTAIALAHGLREPMTVIRTAVNGGNDSDTIAMIAGAVAAAYAAADWVPEDMVGVIEQVNCIDLEAVSAALAGCAAERPA